MPSFGGGDDPWVEVIWTPTFRDVRRSFATALRGRAYAIGAGAVALLAVVATVLRSTVTEDGISVDLLALLLAAPLVLPLAAVPPFVSLLLSCVQPSLRATETLRVDRTGFTFTTPTRTQTILWKDVRRVRDGDDIAVVVAGSGRRTLAAPVPMRVLPAAERTTIRALIAEHVSRSG